MNSLPRMKSLVIRSSNVSFTPLNSRSICNSIPKLSILPSISPLSTIHHNSSARLLNSSLIQLQPYITRTFSTSSSSSKDTKEQPAVPNTDSKSWSGVNNELF